MFINLQIGPQLSRFTPITLDEMEKVRLMNRMPDMSILMVRMSAG